MNSTDSYRLSRFLRLQKHLGEQYDRYIQTGAEALGLTKPEADVLLFLSNNPECTTARDLVRDRALSKAYVSKAVERLISRGYLRSEQGVADRRLQYLTVEPAAMNVVQPLRKRQSLFFFRLTQNFTQEEEAVFDRLLDLFEENYRHL